MNHTHIQKQNHIEKMNTESVYHFFFNLFVIVHFKLDGWFQHVDDRLKELQPYKCDCKIRFLIGRLWRGSQIKGVCNDGLHCLLVDEKVTIPKTLKFHVTCVIPAIK